jgi:hypothetical protein
MLTIVTSCVQNRALLFLVEILGLAAGLAIVLGHNIWSSGLLALIVTLGWVTLIRSIILLFLSPEAIGRFIKAVRAELLPVYRYCASDRALSDGCRIGLEARNGETAGVVSKDLNPECVRGS